MRLVLVTAIAIGCGHPSTAPTLENHSTPPPAASGNATVIAGKSMGKIELGMTRARVRELLGEPSPQTDPDDSFDQYYPLGLSVAYDDGGLVLALHAFSGTNAGYETEPWAHFDLRTPEGITFDMTEQEVVAKMGPPKRSGALDHAPIPSNWIDYGPIQFDFISSNHHLFHVVVAKE